MEAMIERAAEAGARTALREVGLSDDDANSDVKELRNLLDSFRSAKRTVGKTIVQALTTLFLAALMAGAYFNFTDKQWGEQMIKNLLAKIGGPVWRLFQTSKHHHIGAVIVLIVVGIVIWVVI